MRLGPFEFRPGLGPTLATLVLLPLLVWLGHWQLSRAVWKQGLINADAAASRQPPVAFDQLGSDFAAVRYRKVLVSGRYDLDHQLLLDNRIHDGHPGYEVLTPLQLEDGRQLLVNRGWVPAAPDRATLPAVPGPAGRVTLTATVGLPPEKFFRLGSAEEPNHGWPRVVEELKPAQLGAMLGRRLLPVILLLDPGDEGGFVRDWKPVYGVTPDKHRAYALQWFSLALVLVGIYIGVNTKRIKSDQPEQQ